MRLLLKLGCFSGSLWAHHSRYVTRHVRSAKFSSPALVPQCHGDCDILTPIGFSRRHVRQNDDIRRFLQEFLETCASGDSKELFLLSTQAPCNLGLILN
ncbi:hypothetical protein BJV78DRAFT_1232728 [Lactifluus subvellereus]|nr:hypothetical protein BJV78DRAFT_1232728 [Lactifluus subvellereus]